MSSVATPSNRKKPQNPLDTATSRRAQSDLQTRAAVAEGSSTSPAHEFFRRFAHYTAAIVGSPWAFAFAAFSIVLWAALGHHYKYSDTWQLVINTGTTIVTFLMVFLIQNTQNRDARAMHLKLDELIRSHEGARNRMVNLEELSDEQLDTFHKEFQRICEQRHHPKEECE